jgi:hypothetical protein
MTVLDETKALGRTITNHPLGKSQGRANLRRRRSQDGANLRKRRREESRGASMRKKRRGENLKKETQLF